MIEALRSLIEEMGVAALVKQPGLPDLPLMAFFDDGYKSSMSMGSTDPQLSFLSEDFAGISKAGTTITVKAVDYRIKTIEPDGAGLTVVSLTLA